MKKILVASDIVSPNPSDGVMGYTTTTKRHFINLNASFEPKTPEQVYESIYASNCKEQYAFPKTNLRVLSKAHKAKYRAFIKEGGISLYVKYNRI